MLDLEHQGVNLYDWELVKEFLERQNRFTMLEWMKDNRQLFYYSVLSNNYKAL
tara:strand:- start:1943 stop:2101 length:159 start_codon:yes stop_codon:yes gene_type:complete